jgi:hypothetical protein
MPPETLDSLDKDSLKPLVLQLLAQNNELLQQIKTLLARIAELEARRPAAEGRAGIIGDFFNGIDPMRPERVQAGSPATLPPIAERPRAAVGRRV